MFTLCLNIQKSIRYSPEESHNVEIGKEIDNVATILQGQLEEFKNAMKF